MNPSTQDPTQGGLSFSSCMLLAVIASTPTLSAADAAWNLNNNGNWNAGGNWSPATVPGLANVTNNQDTATFGGIITADRTVSLPSNWSIRNLTFNAANRYTISGGDLRLSAGGTAEILGTASGSATISSNSILYGSYTLLSNGNTAASTLTFGTGNINMAASLGAINLTLGGSGTGTIAAPNAVSGPISQASGTTLRVVKEGSSTWAVGASGANSYTGGVHIKAGTLIAQSNNAALGTTASVVTLGNDGQAATLHIGSGRTIANPLEVASGAGARKLSFNATSGGNAAYSGAITLSNDLKVSHEGSQGFTVGAGGMSGTGNVTFENSSSGNLTASGSVNPVGTISHTGAGAGTLTVSGIIGANVTTFIQDAVSTTTLQSASNIYGDTLITRGTLATNAAGKLGLGDVTVGGGDFASILTLGNLASIANDSDLLFHSNATINLSFTGTETIGSLIHATESQYASLGTFNASQLNTFFGVSVFSGSGSLQVTAVPEPDAFALLAGSIGLLVLGRRRGTCTRTAPKA